MPGAYSRGSQGETQYLLSSDEMPAGPELVQHVRESTRGSLTFQGLVMSAEGVKPYSVRQEKSELQQAMLRVIKYRHMPIAYHELLVVSVRLLHFCWFGVFSVLSVHSTDLSSGQLWAHLKPKACESLDSFKKEVPIVSSCHRDRKEVLHHVFKIVEVSQVR